jgi:dihydrofolate synthase/folylpolyglutamate synthase
MFHRIGAAAYKADLSNTYAICQLLDHPEKKFKSIHVAGTNGKGSTSHMLAAIFQTAGYKTGLYTSPHLKDFRERIRINGQMIPAQTVTEFVERYKRDFENISPSFFEWTVGLAFDYFAKEKVDIAIIETGLGGRLDSTNVITPELSIITNISRDHMNLLGNSLENIAREKAGIIKKNIPIVIGQTQNEVSQIFIDHAKQANSEIFFADQHFQAHITGAMSFLEVEVSSLSGSKQIFKLDLTGSYQTYNLITVLQAIEVLNKSQWKIEEYHIHESLKNVRDLTGLQGRWHTISTKPLTICDVGHNEDGIKRIVETLSMVIYNNLHIIFGVVADKNLESVLPLLPKNASYYFCKADSPRSMHEIDLLKFAISKGLKGTSYSSVNEALKGAQNQAKENDLVLVTGSTFVVAEVL